MIYTVGYQPIEIIGRKQAITDIMTLVQQPGMMTGNNLKTAVIDFLKKQQLQPGDKYLFNTMRNKDIIPYVWENLNSKDALSNLFIYDPPYAASDVEIYKLLRELNHHLGDGANARTWSDATNAAREMITNVKDNLSQSEYFNAAGLISDVNNGNPEKLIAHLGKFTQPKEMEVKQKAIFIGDPVDPRFIDYLNAKGTYIVSFLPYDLFLMPCAQVEQYYFTNALFQSPLYMLIELKQLLSQPGRCPDIIYLNPGGIYLTKEEAEFFAYKLSQDIKCEILVGNYSGQPI